MNKLNNHKRLVIIITSLIATIGLALALVLTLLPDNSSSESSSPTSEPIHTHEWDEGEVTKEATCIEEGQITYSCTSCDEVKFETISALGHNEVIDEAKEATCTETGLTEGKHCDRCNEVLVQQEEISSLGHSFADWTIVKEATCESQGTKRRDCNNCDHYEEETIEAKEHNYESIVTNPTCVEQGYETFTCTNCNHSYIDNYVDALGHREVVDTGKEATCTTSGLTEGKHCDRCNEVLVAQEEIPALGHNYGTLINEIPATCTKTGIIAHYHCDRCDKYFDIDKKEVVELTIPLKEHDFNYSIYHYDATGHWFECNNCDERTNHYNHIPNIEQATETNDVICIICDYVIEHALGHTHVMQYTEKVEATCEEKGNIAYYQCKGCKKYYLDENGINEIRNKRELEIAALGHDYESAVTNPTCVEKGYTTHTCSRCDDSYVDSYVEALGHNYGDWVVIVEPGCESVGINRRDCDACDHYEEEEIAALGHNYDSVVTNPTCEEKGYTTHTCDRCQDSYVDSYVNELGHNMITDEKVDPTCEETGLTEGSHCSVCNMRIV